MAVAVELAALIPLCIHLAGSRKQRLYTGRTVIAGSILVFARSLYRSAKNYADNKKCWSPQGGMSLSSVPQLAHLYVQTDKELSRVEALARVVESKLCDCLRNDKIPDSKLVEMVAVLKAW
eukprot:s1398_g27.t1